MTTFTLVIETDDNMPDSQREIATRLRSVANVVETQIPPVDGEFRHRLTQDKLARWTVGEATTPAKAA